MLLLPQAAPVPRPRDVLVAGHKLGSWGQRPAGPLGLGSQAWGCRSPYITDPGEAASGRFAGPDDATLCNPRSSLSWRTWEWLLLLSIALPAASGGPTTRAAEGAPGRRLCHSRGMMHALGSLLPVRVGTLHSALWLRGPGQPISHCLYTQEPLTRGAPYIAVAPNPTILPPRAGPRSEAKEGAPGCLRSPGHPCTAGNGLQGS